MFKMAIDSPPDVTTSPRDRIIQRLTLQGLPAENLEKLQPGLVDFLKDNKFRIPDLVSAILPNDNEVVLAADPRLADHFHESMVWLQWLMFEGEPVAALKNLAKMSVGHRGVCGAVWGDNDIAYRCRTCEHDPTCAICVPCFQNGNHKDHDYSIIYTGGGCCDCGDVTAWKRDGFCSKHKGAEQIQPLPEVFANSIRPVLDLIFIFWKNKLMAAEPISQESSRIDGHDEEFRKVADELTSVVLEMLLVFCKYSESLLSFISGRMLSSFGLLDILVRAERFLSDDIVKKLHELLLKLLGEPLFKYEFAKVFINYYPTVVSEAIKELNKNAYRKYPLLSTFSVQIFTVPTLTPRLVKEKNLLVLLLECLGNIFISCAGEDGRLQVTKLGVLYETTLRVVGDIRFIMSHTTVPEYVTHNRRDITRMWMKLLAFVQGMNPQKREMGIHIEEENDDINSPFVLGHSIANIHALLVAGAFSADNVETDDENIVIESEVDYDDRDSPRHAKVGRLSQESSVSGATGRSSTSSFASKVAEAKSDVLLIQPSSSWLIFECLKAIENWLRMDNTMGGHVNVLSVKTDNKSGDNFFAFKKTLSKIRKEKSIFRSSSSSSASSNLVNSQYSSPTQGGINIGTDSETGRGTGQDIIPAIDDYNTKEREYTAELEALHFLSLSEWPVIQYDVSSEDISVHIPLHRLLSLVLQRVLRRCYGEYTSPSSINASSDSSSATYQDFFGHILGGCHPFGFSAFVMEHPLRIRVFCAQVHAGMWRKNGDTAILSSEWYRSVRGSEQGLEFDLFLLQCCAALAPADLYVNRILERFGLSSYLSLTPDRSSEYEPVLVQEMLTLIIQIVKERRFSGLTTDECLQRELIYKLATGDATHSQLVKSLPPDLSKIDHLQEILDRIAVYSNPSGVNQGMYKLRLQYWKELDLYHPRWNSRDLQIAEERYFRFCRTSALTSQLPRWIKIYNPLASIARLATCRVVLKIVRATLFYAIQADNSTASRAPDAVLLTALHLLSLALDICFQQRESGDLFYCSGDSVPILAFAGEEVCVELNNRSAGQSLLSLLVSLMREYRKEKLGNSLEAGGYDLSSLVESLLNKFAELDSGCMTKLHKLAPEVINHLSRSGSSSSMDLGGSATEGDNRKAKARERQAAMLEKMRAQQSKFLASFNSVEHDVLGDSKVGEEACPEIRTDSVEHTQDVCSLCHDPQSKNPLSYLILLQKSRLLSLVNRSPPLWEQVCCSDREYDPIHSTKINVPSSRDTAMGNSGLISSAQLNQLIQNAVNEFASDGQPREVNAFIEFIKARFPSVRNIQLPYSSNDTRERTIFSFEALEEHMYVTIREQMGKSSLDSDFVQVGPSSPAIDRNSTGGVAESLLLGKYIASLSKETINKPSASGNTRSRSAALSESSTPLSDYQGFGPLDCDGIHVSSCRHAVHQACLDRYLSSLRERYSRRIVFEGGHIVDPDQGEFLCPVCRGLANSVLPTIPGDSFRPPMESTESLSDATGHSTSLNREIGVIGFREALSLLRNAADVAGRSEILQAFPMHRTGRIRPNLESLFRVLSGMYFPGKQDKISGSARVNHSMILWDTLKYSLISTEIAARCGRTSLAPNHAINSLYKELNSSSGFTLSLLLKIVQSMRTKNSLSILLRLRGIQLFAESVCSGVSLDEFPMRKYRRGNMLSILKNVETDVPYPDIQFWRQVSDPVLSRDAFSSLMWVLFCLPSPFLSSEESFLSLVHLFYVVSVVQAIITYYSKCRHDAIDLGCHDGLITDIFKIMVDYEVIGKYVVSNYLDLSYDIKDTIRSLSFPYLRRCALLWKVLQSSTSASFHDGDQVLDKSSHAFDDMMEYGNGVMGELIEVEKLEKMFKLPSLDVVLNDEMLRPVVLRWFHHFNKEFQVRNCQCALHLNPAVPFKLMHLPYLYQDILQRYIKQRCAACGLSLEEPALCLLCGKVCSPNWKICCRESGCQTHAMACGAGIGVFLLIKKTTILLQRSARQAPWPSPYLDAFGEEDVQMNRGKPLFLNEERYAALTHMVASHGLDRSSKVLRQTTTGGLFML
ncbi:E3 ubiquitin-protein ligase PRT6 [Diospyros lotus]|uniref:E3 ubiquitin-protein ligase PRT6 n=1 Tax=Diospyros lotus TaxID=55363 RepID=UPI00225872EA|nr:E3 ubiquitin-protein ligase PRT6 [Diospyros lotus]